jgi:hypothetical protein
MQASIKSLHARKYVASSCLQPKAVLQACTQSGPLVNEHAAIVVDTIAAWRRRPKSLPPPLPQVRSKQR